MKLADYLRLHRILSGVHEHAIWELLSIERDMSELRQIVSEEIRAWIDSVAQQYRARYEELSGEVVRQLEQLSGLGLDPSDRGQRALLARHITATYTSDLIPLLFRALDGKGYQSLIWKQLEPQGVGNKPSIDLQG